MKFFIRCIAIFFGIFAFEVATGWVRAYNAAIDVPICFTKYALLVLFVASRKWLTPKHSLIGFMLSLLGVYALGIIIDQKFPIAGAVSILVSFLGILAGYIILNKEAVWIKLLLPIAVYIFSTWYIITGYLFWYNYINNGTFTGYTNEKATYNWYTYTGSYDTLKADFYKDKIVLFDFWNTTCGVCFIKFPDLERLYQKNKDHPRFVLQAVNIPLPQRDTIGKAFHMIDEKKRYTFPVVVGNEALCVLHSILMLILP